MIEIEDKSLCCGCTACYSICPKQAISMESDYEGFIYPKVNVTKCVECSLCNKVCPVMNQNAIHNEIRKMYEVQCENDDVLKRSASGGFMNLIAQYVLEQKGYVCGAAYNEYNEVEHIIINSTQDIRRLSGSKYVQSNIGNSYKRIGELLKAGEIVCFSGTPCQVAGLNSYLKSDYSNLILVEVLCAGVPSPSLWKKYLNYQEKRYKSGIQNINFRNKTYGYQCSTMMITFEKGQVYSQSGRIDPMMKLFVSGIAKRPSCYNCPFKGDERISDFTIFDGWNAGKLAGIKDNDKGFTAVAVHSKKGKNVFEVLKGMKYYSVDYEKTKKYDGIMFDKQPIKCAGREVFYDYLSNHDIDDVMHYFMPVTKMDLIKEKIKPLLYKIGLIKIVKKIRQIME